MRAVKNNAKNRAKQMIGMAFSAGVGLVIVFPAAMTSAQTPVSQTVAEESACNGLVGAAFGLCNAYCEQQDCDEQPAPACESLRKNFEKQTGSSTFPCDCPASDAIIDADGTLSSGDGVPGSVDVTCGDTLTAFPQPVFNGSGLDMFDFDGNAAWTFGVDAMHAEGPTFCPTAIRDGIHQLGSDCIVVDTGGNLFDGAVVSCDLEVGAFCVPPLPSPISFHDANGNGAWDDGEDIVLDANDNGVFD
ncbi:hypothetical protein WME73_04970 [Sorangium sp. So ce302]|uniref:hypothetical protein n=1 Tax=Sorangium sp. So ce302 TaxID=3133297 RepID=UPI003F620545